MNLETKIEACKEVIKSFATDNPWVAIGNVKLTWTESESDVEGKRMISRKDKSLTIDNPDIFIKGLKEMVKYYENEIKKIKGEFEPIQK